MANRDPVIEYQREGFDMFKTMLDGIQEESSRLSVQRRGQDRGRGRGGAPSRGRSRRGQTADILSALKPRRPRATARRQTVPHQARRHHGYPRTPTERSAARQAFGQVLHRQVRAPGPAVPAEDSAQSKIPALAVKGLAEPKSVPLTYSAPTLDGGGVRPARQTPGTRSAGKTATVSGTATQSRNSPCECGSGKKYKHCHGAPGRA